MAAKRPESGDSHPVRLTASVTSAASAMKRRASVVGSPVVSRMTTVAAAVPVGTAILGTRATFIARFIP